MTITLHWWLVPLLIIAAASFLAWLADSGEVMDFMPAVIFLGGLLAAVAVVLGHFI